MQRIPLALAEEKMVLARDVFRDGRGTGPPICGKGMALTELLIERLKRLGVEAVVVDGHPLRMEGDRSPEEILAALDRRFKKAEGDPLTARLKLIYRQQLLNSAGPGE